MSQQLHTFPIERNPMLRHMLLAHTVELEWIGRANRPGPSTMSGNVLLESWVISRRSANAKLTWLFYPR